MKAVSTSLPIAALTGLPGLPRSRTGMLRWLQRHAVPFESVDAHGETKHYSLSVLEKHLPIEAHCALINRTSESRCRERKTKQPSISTSWSTASKRVRQRVEAIESLLILVHEHESRGLTRERAVREAAFTSGKSRSTIFAYLSRIQNAQPSEWRDLLCHKNSSSQRKKFTTADRFFAVLWHEYYGNQKRTPLRTAWRQTRRDARFAHLSTGEIPSLSTTRSLVKSLRPGHVLLARKGPKAQRLAQLTIRRDRSGLSPLEVVSADGHTTDWFIEWADGSVKRGELLIAVDEYSGLILAHELARSENWVAVSRLFLRVVDTWGIMDEVLTDNGSGFIAKAFSGGSEKPNRRGAKDDELAGPLKRIGVHHIFALPENPQSKARCERTFGMIENQLSSFPSMPQGAFTGNAPGNGPEARGTAAVPEKLFRACLENAIAIINSEASDADNCRGRSRHATFHEDGYNRSLHRQMVAIDRDRFLLPQEWRKPDREGAITLKGNRYHDYDVAVRVRESQTKREPRVIVYYDPSDAGLHDRIWVHDAQGRFLGEMPCQAKAGYRDIDAFRNSARDRREQRKADREERERIARVAEHSPAAIIARDPALATKVAAHRAQNASTVPDWLEKNAGVEDIRRYRLAQSGSAPKTKTG